MGAREGHALATHIECGDVITEDTTLDNPLNRCHEGSAIVIGADNITLDLNGFQVGAGQLFINSPIGIDNSAGHDGVKIENGSVRSSTAVVLRNASRNRLSNLHVAAQEFGISLYRSDRGGWAFDGAAISLNESNANRIRETFGQSYRSAGISLTNSDGNRIENNSGKGLVYGISVDGSADNRIEGNRGFGGFAGLILADADNNRVDGNSGRSSGEGRGGPFSSGAGIWLERSVRNRIVRNTTNSSAFDGIHLAGSARNLVAKNAAFHNGRDGISIDADSSHNRAHKNTASGNGDDGVDVESSATLLKGNTANSNRDLGIEAVPAVMDGGGNRARGNGNPAQCTGVACTR